MQFNDEVTAGTVLVRPAIQSPDYAPGASGWTINVDGSAEFNNIVIRGGTVVSGTALYYKGTPAAGNLALSIAAAPGTDQYGNTYTAGLSIYGDNGSRLIMDGGTDTGWAELRFLPPVQPGVTWTDGWVRTDMDGAGQPALVLKSPTASVPNRQAEISLQGSNAAGDVDYIQINTSSLQVAAIADTHLYGPLTVDGTLTANGAVRVASSIAVQGETWQTPSYNTNWAASTTFNGSTGWQPLQYRRDAEDNVVVIGCFKSASTAGTNPVFTLPAGYRPKQQWPVSVQRNSGGTLTAAMAQVTPSGSFNLLSAPGAPPAAGAEFLVSGRFPLGNLA